MKNVMQYPEVCPFYSWHDSKCLASLHMMSVSAPTARHKCGNEDHDGCPIFLSKMLRRI